MFFILLLILKISTFSKKKHGRLSDNSVNNTVNSTVDNTVEIPKPPDNINYRLLNKVDDSFSKPKKLLNKEPKDNFKINKSIGDLFAKPGPTSTKKSKSINKNSISKSSPSSNKTNGLIQKPFRSENYHYNKHKHYAGPSEFVDVD